MAESPLVGRAPGAISCARELRQARVRHRGVSVVVVVDAKAAVWIVFALGPQRRGNEAKSEISAPKWYRIDF